MLVTMLVDGCQNERRVAVPTSIWQTGSHIQRFKRKCMFDVPNNIEVLNQQSLRIWIHAWLLTWNVSTLPRLNYDYWTTTILYLTNTLYTYLWLNLESKALLPCKTCSYTPATSGTHSISMCHHIPLLASSNMSIHFQLGGQGVLIWALVADFSSQL